MKLGVTVHTYNPSTWEMEVGGSVQGQSQLSETPVSKTSRMCVLGASCRHGYKSEISATNSGGEFIPGSCPKWKASPSPLKPEKMSDISSVVQGGRKVTSGLWALPARCPQRSSNPGIGKPLANCSTCCRRLAKR